MKTAIMGGLAAIALSLTTGCETTQNQSPTRHHPYHGQPGVRIEVAINMPCPEPEYRCPPHKEPIVLPYGYGGLPATASCEQRPRHR